MSEEKKAFIYTKLEDISPEHKIEAFDKIFEMCLYHAKGYFGTELYCHSECDCEVYIAEAAMMRCLGKNVYEQLNDYEDYTFVEL